MKFGMFTSGYQRLPLEKCFTDAAQLGYDYIELWGGYPHAFAPDVIEDYREIRRLQEHYGIPVPVYTPEHNAYPYNYMLGTEKQWRNCMAYLEVSVRAAGLIGARQMLISVGHGGECPAELRRARLRRSVEHLARAAEREHVVLLLETLSPLESNTCTRLHELKELLEAVELKHRRLDVVRTFSRGMTQRLSIARALIHDPDVVFLDEPYSGLDPHAVEIFDDLIDQQREGRTFVMVSHDLQKGFAMCTHALVLAKGKVVAFDEKDAFDFDEFSTLYRSTVGMGVA